MVVPWIRSLIPDDQKWRLDKAQDFQDCVDALLLLVTDEDIYVRKIEAEIRAYPRCNNLVEDKKYLSFLSMKVTKLIDIEQHYVITPSHCTEFFSKLSSITQIKELTREIEQRKRAANDRLGHLNYERPLQNIIVQHIKLIDKTLSGILTGSNINMAEGNQELI